MIEITRAQNERLAEELFVDRTVMLVRDHIQTSWQLTDFQVSVVVRHCIGIARSYRLETERHIIEFVLNMLTISPFFHKQARIQDILLRDHLDGEQRSELLLTETSATDWFESLAIGDAESYWRTLFDTRAAKNMLIPDESR